MFQEGAAHVHVRHHAAGDDHIAVGQNDALRPSVFHQNPLHPRAGDDLAARGTQACRQRLGHAAHAAARIAPGADIAIHIAHRVMEENIGRAGRHRPQRRADDRADGLIGLDRRVLEILVQIIGDRHGPEPDHVIHRQLRQAEHLFAQPGQFGNVARPKTGRIGRRPHQHRPDEAAMAQHIAGIAVIGLGIAFGMAGDLAAVGIMVAEHAQIAAVPGHQRAPLIGQDLKAVSGQLQIAHDLGAEQAVDVRTVGIGEAGVKLAADRRAADPVVLFHHADLQPRPRQIAGRDQPVMPRADDQNVPAAHSAAS